MAILGKTTRYMVPVMAVSTLLMFLSQVDHAAYRARRSMTSSMTSSEHCPEHREHLKDAAVLLAAAAASKPEPVVEISANKIEQIKIDLNDSSAVPPAFSSSFGTDLRPWTYVMNNPGICSGTDSVDVVIMVHTAPNNLDKRQNIRQTFANSTKFLPFQVRTAFLLGETYDREVEQKLWAEHRAHGDTIMGDFKDDYHNLTLKGVMGYRWISEFCQNSKFVLKIDDDVIINMYKLLQTFRMHMHGKKKSIFCNIKYKNGMPVLREGSWKVEPHLFYQKIAYPYDYCSGLVVILTSDLMKPLYEAAKKVPFFWIDDVFLFGMLPSAVGGVTYYNYAMGNNISLKELVFMNCTETQGERCPMFASMILRPDWFITYWNTIENIYSVESWKMAIRYVE